MNDRLIAPIDWMADTVLYYHHGCPDGFAAAWLLQKYIEGTIFSFGLSHGRDIDLNGLALTGMQVVFVDFCPHPDTLRAIAAEADSVVVLDHHKTAMDAVAESFGLTKEPRDELVLDFPGLDLWAGFDMGRSGAGLAWAQVAGQHFPDREMPAWLAHIQDRDLWKFQLDGTAEVFAAITSRPYEFEAWDEINDMYIADLHGEGRAIERYRQQLIGEAVSRHFVIDIAGTEVWATNCIYALGSDVAGKLAEMNPAGIGAYYIDSSADTHAVPGDPNSWIWHPVCEVSRRWGLRSRNEGPDVAELAALLDPEGGGHRNASGFASTYWLNVPGSEVEA